jgi:hypothetical protein
MDFTSLYPSVCKFSRFNTGHPEILTKNLDHTLESYEVGVAQCRVHPPRKLFHPVLPTVSKDRLKFGLCKKCMDTEDLTGCKCSYDQRCLQGCWTIAELKRALGLGYTMDDLQEVYNYPDTLKYDKEKQIHGVFSEMIDFFLK